MTLLEIFQHQQLLEHQKMLSSQLTLDTQYLVNGKLTGILDTTCQPSITCSMIHNTMITMSSTIPLCMIMATSLQKTTL